MQTLSLADIEEIVGQAFDHYLDKDTSNFKVRISDGTNVEVDVSLRDNRFDAGIPGYNMANADVPALRRWIPDHITVDGAVGGLSPCKTVGGTGQVNVVLRVSTMFNFHVNLTGPCQ